MLCCGHMCVYVCVRARDGVFVSIVLYIQAFIEM